jgi:hypothetical protein
VVVPRARDILPCFFQRIQVKAGSAFEVRDYYAKDASSLQDSLAFAKKVDCSAPGKVLKHMRMINNVESLVGIGNTLA